MTGLARRYLRLLGIEGEPCGLSGLRTLVRRHLAAIPFENISKLLLYDREGGGRPITLPEYLDGIEDSDLGGTCYTNNPFLAGLLRELGYEADLLGADMSKPNVHTCIRVRIGSQPYLVDVGFAAPFREPMRLDRLPIRIEEGSTHYVLDRNGSGDGFRMSTFSGTQHLFDYVGHDPPRPREFFTQVVEDSYSLSSTFLQCLRISRIWDGYSLDLWNRELRRHQGGETAVAQIGDMAALERVVHGEFQMRRCPVAEAVAILERLTGRPFF